MHLIYHRGELVCVAQSVEVADAFARACSSCGDTVRVVEEGMKRGIVYKGDKPPVEEQAHA